MVLEHRAFRQSQPNMISATKKHPVTELDKKEPERSPKPGSATPWIFLVLHTCCSCKCSLCLHVYKPGFFLWAKCFQEDYSLKTQLIKISNYMSFIYAKAVLRSLINTVFPCHENTNSQTKNPSPWWRLIKEEPCAPNTTAFVSKRNRRSVDKVFCHFWKSKVFSWMGKIEKITTESPFLCA